MERQETEIEVEHEEVVPVLAPGGGKLPANIVTRPTRRNFHVKDMSEKNMG